MGPLRPVYGIQPVREAVRVHGAAVERLYVELRCGPKVEALARYARDQGIGVEELPRAELDRRTGGGRHQGVVALAPELRLTRLEALSVVTGGAAEPGAAPLPASLFVALDGVMDPQNFGAVVRSSVALGAGAILWPEHSSAPLTPATFRASAGAIEHAVLCRVGSLPHALEALAERGMRSIALDAQAPVALGEVDLRGPVVLVIGAEDRGTRKSVRRACAFTARLPMGGPIASLNASVAGALALYEVLRQRGGGAAPQGSPLASIPPAPGSTPSTGG